jgi:oxygen-independent coproporphyrinogen-3 oxidase
VTWVAKQQRSFERVDLPGSETKLRIFALALSRFTAAGYEPIGMDHFARSDDPLSRARHQGELRRNFMGYTTQPGDSLIGFGPSAISELPLGYAQSRRDFEDWASSVEREGIATLRGHRFTEQDRIRRSLIEAIMCHGKLDFEAFRQANGASIEELFPDEMKRLTRLEEDRLIELESGVGLTLTAMGRLLVRHVASAFDAYLPDQRTGRQPLFSKAI